MRRTTPTLPLPLPTLLLLVLVPLLLLVPRVRASADSELPQTPCDVHADTVGGVAVTWVDWGAAGGARARDSQLIAEEQEALRRFLHAPELKAAVLSLAGACQDTQAQWLRARLAQCRQAYDSREQTTALPCSHHPTHEVVALPSWAWGLPLPLRASTQVLIFDDRDPAQRQWVLAHAHDDQRLSYAYCTGWTSGDDRDRFWKEHPMLGIHPVASDQFAVSYGITSYPALVRFDLETMELTQGLEP